MKKILSVFLACLVFVSAFGCLALAADGYKETYAISLDEETGKRMNIVPVKYPFEKNEDGSFVTLDSFYAAEGDDFYFLIVPVGSYLPDQTTRYKAYPQTIYVDIIKGREGPGVELNPDAEGVYCIENVTEDMVIMAYNLQEESLAWVKDFLLDFGNFFINLITWFFGLFKG